MKLNPATDRLQLRAVRCVSRICRFGVIHSDGEPATHGTARQAVRHRDGREAVEALINQIERDSVRMTPPLDAPDIVREARETLRLKRG
ncbi:MAG: hypothetical protein AB1761_06720 [Pseudomonadota bacterium]